MKVSKSQIKNSFFLIFIIVMFIPQTRKPIQILLNKGLALISPSTIDVSKQAVLNDYNWKLKDESGNLFLFEKVKGKVVLVNFWATWCPPCIAEMPSLQKLYNDYKDKMEFVFVSNEDRSAIRQFLKDKGYTFSVVTPLTNYPDAFDVSSIPRTFLMDKTGRIIIDKTGAANWNSESVRTIIDELLSTEY